MFSKLATLTLLLLLSVSAMASDSTTVGWQKSLTIDFTTTQTGYSNSWVGGEAGSINWVSNLNSSAEKHLSPKFKFKSTLKLSFGQTSTQDAETKDWSKAKKSTDLIDFENVGDFTLGGFVDPYVAFRVESQFFDARKDDHKLYFSPLKFTESAGILKHLLNEDKRKLQSRLGLAVRQTMKTDIDSVEIGVGMYDYLGTVDSTLTDGGLELVTDAEFQINEKLKYTGKLGLFKAFFFSESDAVKGTQYEDDWKAIDVSWENIVSAQITKIVTVNLYTQFLYDKQISKKGRFKETVAIGFVFKML